MPDGGSASALVAAIEREFAAFGVWGGVAAQHLGTGEEIRIGADAEIATASTIKVPILIELYRRAEAGEVDLDEPLPVTPAVRVLGSGVLRELSDGVALSIRDHATLMIVVSDNVATNLLIDRLGIPAINATMDRFGFPRTRLRQRLDFPRIGEDGRNLAVSTPGELAGVMAALATGAILGEASRAEILGIMRRQQRLNLVPRYLPYDQDRDPLQSGEPDNGLRIANKTGGWGALRADMALVEWPGTRYVVAIVAHGEDDRFWPENPVDRAIGRVSRLIFDHFGGGDLAGRRGRAASPVAGLDGAS